MSRFWCLFISSTIFLFAQICGTQIENPHSLSFLSGLTGLAYGFLFGVYPSLVADIWREWLESELGQHDACAYPLR